MGKAGGGRNEIDPRFLSLCCVFNMTFPSDDTVYHIYSSILEGHFQMFSADIRSLIPNITKSLLALYKVIIQSLPPTPSKFHYIFNLRDLSRVCGGLCLTTPDRFTSPEQFIRVWRNECLRVFFDRLINDEDRSMVQKLLNELLETNFPEQAEYAKTDPILFGDYRTALEEGGSRVYEDIQDYEAAKSLFQEVSQLCYMLDACLPHDCMSSTVLECYFLQALYWSLGATLLEDGREKLDAHVKEICGLLSVSDTPEKPARAGEIPTSEKTLYEFYFDGEKQVWIAWNQMVPKYQYDPGKKFSEILVPTVDTVRSTWLLGLVRDIHRPAVLVGDTGTSKTATILNFLRQLDQNSNFLLPMNFSSRTASIDVQRNLEANVEKRTKDTYGPPVGKCLLLFIDDMNMPQVRSNHL
ncbi:dynein heavy chain 10, axonemal-like [Limulus polyphemus]|uniref:Dynein heavy chain 10, axonemal-like n=1 Tax=Limulus polyphemus TaxID=6850 RepID=A0ABM1S6Y5_LIMPO|nr:dynein heavy chain 10, axonemal-like [Limulus polyphemus]